MSTMEHLQALKQKAFENIRNGFKVMDAITTLEPYLEAFPQIDRQEVREQLNSIASQVNEDHQLTDGRKKRRIRFRKSAKMVGCHFCAEMFSVYGLSGHEKHCPQRNRIPVVASPIKEQSQLPPEVRDTQWGYMVNLVGDQLLSTSEITDLMIKDGWKFRSANHKSAVGQSIVEAKKRPNLVQVIRSGNKWGFKVLAHTKQTPSRTQLRVTKHR